MSVTLTNEEATYLIDMAKHYIESKRFDFPNEKGQFSFDVVGTRNSDEFTVNIQRKGINFNSCTYQGRTKASNTVLMRLDVNPNAAHINPDDLSKITGTHLHVYSEKYGDKIAVPFDTKSDSLYETCFTFFKKFNIINAPGICCQEDFYDKLP